LCPKCKKEGLGPYVKTIKGNPYLYVAHRSPSGMRWCYAPKHALLNPTFFRNEKFTDAAELGRMIYQLLAREGLSDLRVKKVYIHGSQVKGTYTGISDLDVWVQVEKGFETPIVLTATKRMVSPPKSMSKLVLSGIGVEVVCSSLRPKPPYFDVFEQRLVLK